MIRRPPRSTLFPSTPLFLSVERKELKERRGRRIGHPLINYRSDCHRIAVILKRRRVVVRNITGREPDDRSGNRRSEEHTSELQSRQYLVCRVLLEKKNKYRY